MTAGVSAVDAVLAAAKAYGVGVLLLPPNMDLGDEFLIGPMGCAGVMPKKMILGVEDGRAEPEEVLHELCHLIIGPHSVRDRCDEAWVLMPFEWRLAKHLAKRVCYHERQGFLTRVRSYQDGTTISGVGYSTLGDLGRAVRRQKWWREAERRVVALGLLDEGLVPTYQMPNWKAGVPRQHAKDWEPG